MTLEYEREREEADARRRAMVSADPRPRGAILFESALNALGDHGVSATKRVNWCSRCSSAAVVADRTRRKVDATPSVAQPGGSLCTACAPVEYKAHVAQKIGACNAKDDKDGASRWLELQRLEESRVARGGKGRAEYPFTLEEQLGAQPAADVVEMPDEFPVEQASFWGQFARGTGT